MRVDLSSERKLNGCNGGLKPLITSSHGLEYEPAVTFLLNNGAKTKCWGWSFNWSAGGRKIVYPNNTDTTAPAFKNLLITYKALNSPFPVYITGLLRYVPTQHWNARKIYNRKAINHLPFKHQQVPDFSHNCSAIESKCVFKFFNLTTLLFVMSIEKL